MKFFSHRFLILIVLFLSGGGYLLSKLNDKEEQSQRLQADLEERIAIDPGDEKVRFTLVKAAIINEDFDVAKTNIEELRKQYPLEENYAVYEIKIAYYRQEFQRAIELIDKFKEQYPYSLSVKVLEEEKEQIALAESLPPMKKPVLLKTPEILYSFGKVKRFYPTMDQNLFFLRTDKKTGFFNFESSELLTAEDIFKGWEKVPREARSFDKFYDAEIFPPTPGTKIPHEVIAFSTGENVYYLEKSFSDTNKKGYVLSRIKELEKRKCDFPGFSPWQDFFIASCLTDDRKNRNYDLFLFIRNSKGEWKRSRSKSLKQINTAMDEREPRISNDGAYLYFNSNGYPSYGGQDFFISEVHYTLKENGKTEVTFNAPDNISPDLNSIHNERQPIRFQTGQRQVTTIQHTALDQSLVTYKLNTKVPLPSRVRPVMLRVYSSDGKKINTEIQIKPLTNKGARLYSDEVFHKTPVLNLLSGTTYGFRIRAQGYMYFYNQFNLPHGDKTLIIEARLQPIKPGSKITANSLTFASGSARLTESSFEEIDIIKDLLDKNPAIGISIEGHTDNIGSKTGNAILSYARAESVRNALMDRGIRAQRMRVRGWGDRKPIVPNTTEANRARNRRTEIIVIEPAEKKIIATPLFVNASGNNNLDWLEAAVNDSLKTSLDRRLDYVKVPPEETAGARKQVLAGQGKKPYTEEQLKQLATIAGADIVITGSISSVKSGAGDRLSLRMVMYSIEDQKIIFNYNTSGPNNLLFFNIVDQATVRAISRLLEY